jgi:CRISPR/Cas system-associated exonuclease Cas4 (RecB family)
MIYNFAPYSYSKLSTHKQCNRKFKYAYIDKAPKSKISDMTPLLKGGAVHNILEHYPNLSTHKLAPKYQYIADNFIASNLGQKYLSKDSVREFDFGLTKDLKPTTYKDKDALFKGSIDYITRIDDTLHLNDWKTGKLKEEKWQDFDQLLFYAIYFFIRYTNINKIVISYVYVEHNNHENTITLDRIYLKRYVTELFGLIKDAENDTVYKRNITPLCGWCAFEEHCNNDPS